MAGHWRQNFTDQNCNVRKNWPNAPTSGSPSFLKTNVLFFSWSMITIFCGALKYTLSTLLIMNIIRVSLELKWRQTMKFSGTQAYFRLKYNCISLFSTTIPGLQVVKIVQGLQTFYPH